jgi:hypothetical protein
MDTASTVASKFVEFASTCTDEERDVCKLLLGLAAGGLSAHGDLATNVLAGQAFKTVTACAARLQPYKDRIPYNGIAWRGRPGFLTEQMLRSLAVESDTLRSKAIRYDDHFLATNGPVAGTLANSEALSQFIEQHTGPIEKTGVASYLYYEEEGQGISPHIDTEVFSINLIICVSHTAEPSSHLVVYPSGLAPERILLTPGEVVILFADSVIHAREPMKACEAVRILTIGFQPTSDSTLS